MTADDHSIELTRVAAHAAAEKLANDILAFDVSDQLGITDVFLLCSGNNPKQVGAICEEIEDRLREMGVKPSAREGQSQGRWVLLDFDDIVVHVMHAEERAYYTLERLWRDCPVIDLP